MSAVHPPPHLSTQVYTALDMGHVTGHGHTWHNTQCNCWTDIRPTAINNAAV